MSFFPFPKKKLSKEEKRAAKIKRLISKDSHFAFVEAYKRMRTNLLFMLGKDKKVIAFTSTDAGEGKTTNCLNLGIAFGQAGNKTLIIDMDMRKPQVHSYFNISLKPGLSDFLAKFEKKPIIYPTPHENLFVLPAGTTPPSPPELLMTNDFIDLVEELKKDYDYIFIDTPPVHLVSDLSVVAEKLDGIVFVVREGAVPIELLKKAVVGLERVGAKILGFVLNDAGEFSVYSQYQYRRKYGYGYRYSYGYGPSSDDEN